MIDRFLEERLLPLFFYFMVYLKGFIFIAFPNFFKVNIRSYLSSEDVSGSQKVRGSSPLISTRMKIKKDHIYDPSFLVLIKIFFVIFNSFFIIFYLVKYLF